MKCGALVFGCFQDGSYNLFRINPNKGQFIWEGKVNGKSAKKNHYNIMDVKEMTKNPSKKEIDLILEGSSIQHLCFITTKQFESLCKLFLTKTESSLNDLYEEWNPKICLKRGWMQKISIKKQLGNTKDKIYITLCPGKIFGWSDEKTSYSQDGIPIFAIPINEEMEIIEDDSSIKFTFPNLNSEDIIFYFSDNVEARDWYSILQRTLRITEKEIHSISHRTLSVVSLYLTKSGQKETQWVSLIKKLWGNMNGCTESNFEMTSDKWTQVGYSSSDPSDIPTIALNNFIYLAENYPLLWERVQSSSKRQDDAYSWVGSGIELTEMLTTMLSIHKYDRNAMPYIEGYPLFIHSQNCFEELYCIAVALFEQNWEQNTHDKKKNDIKDTIHETSTRFSQFISRASSDGSPEIFEMLGILLEPYRSQSKIPTKVENKTNNGQYVKLPISFAPPKGGIGFGLPPIKNFKNNTSHNSVNLDDFLSSGTESFSDINMDSFNDLSNFEDFEDLDQIDIRSSSPSVLTTGFQTKEETRASPINERAVHSIPNIFPKKEESLLQNSPKEDKILQTSPKDERVSNYSPKDDRPSYKTSVQTQSPIPTMIKVQPEKKVIMIKVPPKKEEGGSPIVKKMVLPPIEGDNTPSPNQPKKIPKVLPLPKNLPPPLKTISGNMSSSMGVLPTKLENLPPPPQPPTTTTTTKNEQTTNLPSNLPNNLPNNLPPNLPSNLPSNLPNNLPSSFPTNLPPPILDNNSLPNHAPITKPKTIVITGNKSPSNPNIFPKDVPPPPITSLPSTTNIKLENLPPPPLPPTTNTTTNNTTNINNTSNNTNSPLKNSSKASPSYNLPPPTGTPPPLNLPPLTTSSPTTTNLRSSNGSTQSPIEKTGNRNSVNEHKGENKGENKNKMNNALSSWLGQDFETAVKTDKTDKTEKQEKQEKSEKGNTLKKKDKKKRLTVFFGNKSSVKNDDTDSSPVTKKTERRKSFIEQPLQKKNTEEPVKKSKKDKSGVQKILSKFLTSRPSKDTLIKKKILEEEK